MNKPKAIFWSVLTLISGFYLAVSPITGVGFFGRSSPFWVAPSILCLLLFYGSLMTCVRAWGGAGRVETRHKNRKGHEGYD